MIGTSRTLPWLLAGLIAAPAAAWLENTAPAWQEVAAPVEPASITAPTRRRIEVRCLEWLEDLRAAHALPGVSAALVLPDGSLMPLCAGLADVEAAEAMTPERVLFSGSVGKTYFSAAAHHLRAAGELDFDARVATFFEGEDWYARLPNAQTMTVRHLLRHRSGLARYVFAPGFFEACRDEPDRIWTVEERLGLVAEVPARFEAGQGWSYADTNFVLLAAVIERASGASAYAYMREHLLEPHGLSETHATERRDLPGLSQGYTPMSRGLGFPERVVEDGALVYNCQFEWGGGGFASSARDLARWAWLLYRGEAFEGEYLETMLETVPARLEPGKRYGHGVMVRETELGKQIGHDGFFPGYTATMGYFPEVELAAALMLNSDGGLGRLPLDHATERLAKIAAEELAGEGPLRVLAYNIRHGEGTDGELDLERIAGVIEAAAPDLVALQEVDLRTARTERVDQLGQLAGLTGMSPAFAKFMDYQGGEYGLGLLSRYPVAESERIALPPGQHEPRAVAAASIDVPGAGRLRFVSLHLDWLGDDTQRFAQAQALVEALAEVGEPVILAGDFNDVPGSRTMELFTSGFANAEKSEGARATFPSTGPEREIDFVLYRPAASFEASARVLDEPFASDHCPVLAELRWIAPEEDE